MSFNHRGHSFFLRSRFEFLEPKCSGSNLLKKDRILFLAEQINILYFYAHCTIFKTFQNLSLRRMDSIS